MWSLVVTLIVGLAQPVALPSSSKNLGSPPPPSFPASRALSELMEDSGNGEAPVAYVKLDTNGSCQGWSLSASGSSPEDCWALCIQSNNCGATTFFHYSGDTCTRGPTSRRNLPPQTHTR